MANIPTEIIKVTRPVHWVKNLAIFAALIFSGDLFSTAPFARVLVAFVAFSLAASASYIFNDIFDAEKDKLHPTKKDRPIASGRLPIKTALTAMLALAVSSIYISSLLGPLFFASILAYLLLQLTYSLGLKNIAIVDILIIAAGFIIRVYAGAFVINVHLSVWFLLCVISVALFLASGKRRAELGAISQEKTKTRESLSKYTKTLLDSYVTMFGNAAWLSWALFTFFESPTAATPVWLFLAEISKTTAVSKLLMLTIPVTIFGIMRYQALIFENRSETPERLLLTDAALVASGVIWLGLVTVILYGGVASAV